MKKSERSLFSPYHVVDAVKCLFKKRPNNKRLYLGLTVTLFVIIVIPYIGEASIRYLYVRTRYGWEVEEYSLYRSIDVAIGAVGKNT